MDHLAAAAAPPRSERSEQTRPVLRQGLLAEEDEEEDPESVQKERHRQGSRSVLRDLLEPLGEWRGDWGRVLCHAS
jgi:hypothetical protein